MNYSMIQSEIIVYVPDGHRMFDTLLKLEKSGYNVTDVLPRLRAFIIELTATQQQETIKHSESQLWNNAISKLKDSSKNFIM